MIKEVVMPKLGITMTEGIIEKWLVQEGSSIEKGQPLLDIMSDKAVIEVEAPESGRLVKILRRKDETVPVSEVIGLIEC